MSLYGDAREEALRARDLLKDWTGEGYLSAEQYQQMEPDTACDLRRTNIFLRLVLFLFTLLIVAAATGLWLLIFGFSSQSIGPFFLFLSPVCYAGAWAAASRGRLYRYGVEEALAVCFVGFLCAGLELTFFEGRREPAGVVVPVAGCLACYEVWRRFGLPYATLGAMALVAWAPVFVNVSPTAHRWLAATSYATALAVLIRLRPGHRFTYLDAKLSLTEALLWFGLYAALNLQLRLWVREPAFTGTAYWATWVLTWCLPPVILWRALRAKDRMVLAAGGFTALLTLVTNKEYLGQPHHPWDPMLLGAFLIVAALLIGNWLAQGPDGIRQGFTARRLSGKDRALLDTAATALGAVTPDMLPQRDATASDKVRFGGGEFGGGGASSDF